MIISHEREKLIDAIIFFITKTKYCGLTKLFKLLNLLDFIHFRQTGRSVTGQDYYAWERGPVPADLFFEVKNRPDEDLKKSILIIGPDVNEGRKLTKIKAKRKFDGRYFTKREIGLLEMLAEIFRDATADQMVEVSHLKNHPWDKTIKEKGEKAKIDYMLALDGSDQSQLDREEILARLHEMDEVKRNLH